MQDHFGNPKTFTYILKDEEIQNRIFKTVYEVEVTYMAHPATGALDVLKISMLPGIVVIVKDWHQTNMNIKSAAYADIQKL